MTIHDIMVSRLIVENLAKNGKVTLEEAKFYTDFTRNILNKLVEETINELNGKKNIKPEKEINESEDIIKKLIK